MTDPTLYLVTDIETDGPNPGAHSMLSFGCVATDAAGARGEFTINLAPLEGAAGDPRTMQWWATQPEAWAASTTGAVPPAEAMARFAAWVRGLPAPPVFAACPLAFDGTWMDWYLRRFCGLKLFTAPYDKGALFQGAALDMSSLAMGVLGLSHAEAEVKPYPVEWLGGHAHTHCALDDARGYAHLLRELLRRRPPARVPLPRQG
ncbi:MAG: polymerase subunit epsilon [Roseomonas sp.]|nr:polymerase subunit epsilon [Roseomonas sp.]